MHKQRLNARLLPHLCHQRRDLDKIRPGSDNAKNFHRWVI
jgi:hypothetical protein